MNGVPSVQGPIIAANLNQGDPIPPPNTYTVNKTETQTYLGISRTVNILNPTITTPDYTTSFTFVYDRASGILLEATSITIQNQPQPTPSEYSYIITETNIFGTSQTTPTPSSNHPRILFRFHDCHYYFSNTCNDNLQKKTSNQKTQIT